MPWGSALLKQWRADHQNQTEHAAYITRQQMHCVAFGRILTVCARCLWPDKILHIKGQALRLHFHAHADHAIVGVAGCCLRAACLACLAALSPEACLCPEALGTEIQYRMSEAQAEQQMCLPPDPMLAAHT